MPDLPDLDTRIRDLVARAVADAPTAPEIGAPDMPTIDQPDRRRWWVGGTAAVLAAAAAVVTLALVVDDDNATITPASVPTTLQPEPTTATSVPSTPVSTSPAPTTAAPSSTTVTPAPRPTGLLTAGPDGVREHAGGSMRTVTTESVVMALDAGDGRTIVQRQRGDRSGGLITWTDADTVPLVVAEDGTLTPLLPDLDWGGGVVLHDVEVVDGRRLLLYSVMVGPISFDTGQEDLWVVDLATGERTSIALAIGGWEYGTGRLHLASTGLVVGAASGGPTTRPALFAVPGSTIAVSGVPDTATLGLPVDPGCEDCPRAFTVSADGSLIAWIATTGEVVGVTIDQGAATGAPRRLGPAPVGSVRDLELAPDGFVASFDDTGQGAAPPIAVDWDGASTTLDGTAATMSPGAVVVPADPSTPATSTPTTTTSLLPVDRAGVVMVTAGADGVAVIEDGVEVLRLDQPAEIALLTPGGTVIFQTARPTSEGTPGDPQIWRPDGTVAPFLGPLPAGQSYRLHDVAQIDGVPTVLYGVRTNGPSPAEYTETVKALRMDPVGWVTDDIATVSTWEGGFSRLSLSDQGLIIGTAGESVTSSFFGAVVPRSPAAGQGDPMVPPDGVEPSYSECGECPDAFTIAADGSSVAWTEGTQLVVVEVATGERRSWTVSSLAIETLIELDVRTAPDGGVEAAMSMGWPGQTDAPTAVVAATSPAGEVVETDTGARTVTFGP